MPIICRFKDRAGLLLLLGVLLLLLLYVFQNWLAAFLICYVTILVLLGLIGLVRLVQGVLRKSCQKFAGASKGTGSEGHLPSKPVYVPPHIYKRPDPMIYSQQYLMSKGIGVTWDNPDIQLYDGNTPVSSHQLEIKHTYRIRAEIWNGSWDAPVVNMLVRFHYLSFGIGTVKNYIGQTFVDVPVKGAAGLPSVADCDWTTPEAAGHYCIQVELVWADDANPFNNLGQENTDVKKLNSPNATFQFTLRNDSALPRKLELRADTYTLPPKEPCAERTRDEQWRSERDPFDRHRLGLYPLPEGWRLNLEPGDTLEMRPGEERIITLNVTARDDFVGQQAININAFDGRDLVGGVTLFVHS